MNSAILSVPYLDLSKAIHLTKITGFLVGTVLHLILLNSLKQRRYLRGEVVFIFFMFSLECWFLGNFLSLFSHLLIIRPVYRIPQFFDSIACIGAGLFAPFLIHTLLNFAEQKESYLPKPVKHFLLGILYSATLLTIFPLHQIYQSLPQQELLQTLEFFIWPFSCYLSVILLLAIYLCHLLDSISREEEDIRFYRAMTRSLILVFTLHLGTFVLGFRKNERLGEILEITSLLSAIVPTFVFSYYIYRYHYMEFVLKKSLVNSVLLMLTFSLYLFGIHRFESRFTERYNLNFDIAEAIMVMTMVFLFTPLKNKLQKGLTRLFYQRQGYYHAVFTGLDQRLTIGSLMNSPHFLNDVAYILSKGLVIHKINIVFFEKTSTGIEITESTIHRDDLNLEPLLLYLEESKVPILYLSEIEDKLIKKETLHFKGIKKEMQKLKAHLILPIRKEGALVGLLTLGKRPLNRPLYEEELNLLSLASFQLITALDNAKLIQKTFQLERKMMELDKLTSLGLLSASMAHEVKNPLSSIKAIAQVLREETPEKFHEDLDVILSELDRLARVVEELLHYSKPLPTNKGAYPLKKVIDSVFIVLTHEAQLKKIELQNEIEPDLEVRADGGTLKDVFFNLILNAIQMLPEGGRLRILAEVRALPNKPHKPEQV
ncbi:MAG: histidine kinase dimerization/phospho-acceptor domain-containing protein, partial [Planctomycetota bacterium]